MKSMLLSSLVALFLVACSYREDTIVTMGDYSYLKFDTKRNLIVTIDDTQPFEAKGGNRLYRIKSGKSHVKITDTKGNLIIEKNIYVGNQNTYEFALD
nr:hypothetical protein [Campylobacter sp.]